MTRNLRLLTAALTACASLAACATPREQCITRQTSELRNVARLLAEVEGNLSRGYAWDERQVTRTEWDECRRVLRNRDGEARVIHRPCLRDVTDVERFRVALDPAAETRKRDFLRSKQAQLTSRANAGVAACKAAYPAEG